MKKETKTRAASKRTSSGVTSKVVARTSVSKSQKGAAKKAVTATKSKSSATKLNNGRGSVSLKASTQKKATKKSIPVAKRSKTVVTANTKKSAATSKLAAAPKGKVVTSATSKSQGSLATPARKQGNLTRRATPSAITVIKRVPPPPPEPPRRQPSTGVIKGFEHAVKVFNRRQFAEARELFEGVQSRYPQEVEINARAQTYIQVCNQKLARPISSPRDADELYDRGVVALNIGDFTQARQLFEKALRMRPDEAHLLYSLAATYAQTGSADEALDYLHRSIQIQPRYRNQVISDTDFTQLHNDKRFLDILGVSSAYDLLDSAQ